MNEPTKPEIVHIGEGAAIARPEIDRSRMERAETMLQMAIEKGLSMEMLEKLLQMRKELRLEVAEEAFNDAFAAFQAQCPVIKKTKEADFETATGGRMHYTYAPIESMIEQVGGLLGRLGFSYNFTTETLPTGIKAYCHLTHSLGFTKTGDFTADVSGTRSMSNAQVTASKETFAKRKAFCNVTGIVTGDEDNDGLKGKDEVKDEAAATPEQFALIDQLIVKAGVTKAAVTTKCREHYKVSFTDITKTQALGLIQMLKNKINEQPT